jgi:hypothetical protein
MAFVAGFEVRGNEMVLRNVGYGEFFSPIWDDSTRPTGVKSSIFRLLCE